MELFKEMVPDGAAEAIKQMGKVSIRGRRKRIQPSGDRDGLAGRGVLGESHCCDQAK